jgi:hypothetical protein
MLSGGVGGCGDGNGGSSGGGGGGGGGDDLFMNDFSL